MAIEINNRRLPITPQEACVFLQKETDSFGVFFDMDRCYELAAIMQLNMTSTARRMRRVANNPTLHPDDKDALVNSLVKMGVSKGVFYQSGSLSFDAKIRKSLILSDSSTDDVVEFCKLCDSYTSDKRNKGNIENFANRGMQSLALSKLGHRMSIGHPLWSLLNTSRIAAKDPGIQGIPRSMSDIICEPAGYTLVRADSGQIEPRINFSAFARDDLIVNLITAYRDAYYGIMHFCRMNDIEEKKCRDDFDRYFEKLDLSDEIADMRQNIKTLTLAGSYGSTKLEGINPQYAALYDRKIVQHPARKAQEQKVRDQVRRGDTTFYGYFGTPVTPGETERYTPGTSGWDEHVVRCGVNNPIQTTASELMMFSINKAREILSRAKDTHICFYKHDEACFYVSDEDMANGIGDELSEVTAYNVKGWIPIESDVITGIKKGDYPSYLAS